ncbi:YolA family protein [Bacillus sp. IBL03825]|uniref:YolA family protein n=1 Tax=Bacillus sp. IBL03825 TaxID=2953580 RepID=UPI002156FD92|nr:YolA family protein [Bacillus sp. IBL03825]MCR6850515.1 YolA family protein [Bacillus sp. IBL03825]MCR6850546.1 YolA family protein [Bacillus sp. IBL03825]
MFKKLVLGVTSLAIASAVGLGFSSEASAAPAPPLTSVKIVKVESQFGGVEFINSNSLSTSQHHGGSYLYVYTRDMGYGSNPGAQMNGGFLKKVGSTPIDVNGDRTIDGWEYKWDASVYQSGGQFQYKNRSTNAPWNTLSTSLNIR